MGDGVELGIGEVGGSGDGVVIGVIGCGMLGSCSGSVVRTGVVKGASALMFSGVRLAAATIR